MSKAFCKSMNTPYEYNFLSTLVSISLIVSKIACSVDLFGLVVYGRDRLLFRFAVIQSLCAVRYYSDYGITLLL